MAVAAGEIAYTGVVHIDASRDDHVLIADMRRARSRNRDVLIPEIAGTQNQLIVERWVARERPAVLAYSFEAEGVNGMASGREPRSSRVVRPKRTGYRAAGPSCRIIGPGLIVR